MKDAIYNHQKIEEKWKQIWKDKNLFQDAAQGSGKNKLYLLFAFAYPSGSGLHVGHVESETALDILARFYRMKSKEVFFPVGWDAFGLPAENYAIKTGVPPAVTTQRAINTFRKQLRRIGISYDWANEIATCRSSYYRWTQWLFLELFRAGLAYRAEGKVNWCLNCQTVLANEQVVNGLCERCDHEIRQKRMKQWYFKITQYQDELIDGLDKVDWPEPTKQQQINWIGRSEGVQIDFKFKDLAEKISCFTTRLDTIFGVSFIVLSPEKFIEMRLGAKLDAEFNDSVSKYVVNSLKKTEEERKIGEKKKTGVDTGLKVINPVNGQTVPVWVADYVLPGYGTGAVMGVPAHDNRDWEFAQKFGLKITRVVEAETKTAPGILINSAKYNGLTSKEATEKILSDFPKALTRTRNYRLRDWLISRQRYWGAPIPIIYDPEGKPHPIGKKHLPWRLPEDVDFKPTGESPLRFSREFLSRTQEYARENFAKLIEREGWDENGAGWTPEYDTMDTFVDSSWYYLRYCDSRNSAEFASAKQLRKWLPVDFYMIGPEHIVLHLLYSRFFTKFLADQGYLEFREPFMKMRHQGMILGPDGKKMSKSKGNIINPDDVVEKFGADTLRVYEMFLGPIEADKPWNDRSVVGIYRFLKRIYQLASSDREIGEEVEKGEIKKEESGEKIGDKVGKNGFYSAKKLQRKLHQTIKKVSTDIPELKFNTAIASLMEFVNVWESVGFLPREDILKFVRILAPFAPFLADELWHKVQVLPREEKTVHQTKWPSYDLELTQDELKRIPVQVNGKLRAELVIDASEFRNLDREEIFQRAAKLKKIIKWLKKRQIKKKIYVSGKIVNFVV